MNFHTKRAWLVLNTEALVYNAHVIQSMLPLGCQLMAVVKANAYGHGAAYTAQILEQQSGVNAFAVATLEEGIALRSAGVHGEILILGYTPAFCVKELAHYHLIQTVTDPLHAAALAQSGTPIQIHLKFDTGMHRLGTSAQNLSSLLSLLPRPNLHVTGVFTHLCASDSMAASDIDFTRKQLQLFYHMLAPLQHTLGAKCKVHIQSSYGLLNYPELQCDYARVGLFLYGVHANTMVKEACKTLPLRPVLSCKARIAVTHAIAAHESVGYGMTFTAQRSTRLAVLPIGYADGLPRNLSEAKIDVLIRGKRAPVIGRICMDQCIVDVTDVPEAAPGDIATLIGRDGMQKIEAEAVAQAGDTITNELLCRLGTRLPRVWE